MCLRWWNIVSSFRFVRLFLCWESWEKIMRTSTSCLIQPAAERILHEGDEPRKHRSCSCFMNNLIFFSFFLLTNNFFSLCQICFFSFTFYRSEKIKSQVLLDFPLSWILNKSWVLLHRDRADTYWWAPATTAEWNLFYL